jgi:hypothetical protein
MPVRRALTALAIVLIVSASSPVLGAQEQEQTLPAQLLKGGKVYLVNDLQAWADAMLVFRQFRRDFRRIDRFEEEGDREQADLVCMLSGDPDVAEQHGIVNRGIPYPSGLNSSKIMLLLIFDAKTNNLLYFDAVDWDTAANATRRASYTKLVVRLRTALDEAG